MGYESVIYNIELRVNTLFFKIKIMAKKIVYCDVCGKEFSSPDEGQIQQGFGICNECGND